MQFRLLLIFLLSGICESFAQTTYCIPNPPNGIDGYSIDSIHLESLDTAFTGSVYQFISDNLHHQTCYLVPGSTYKLYLKSGSQAVSTLGAWIDWNNDTTLASTEKLGEINTTTPNEVHFISFTVPVNCFKGKLRLRIRNSNSSSLNACNDYLGGQILDFTITTINNFYEHNYYSAWEFSSTAGNVIDGVRISNLNNQNTGNTNGPVYGDYSYLTADLTACNLYYLVLTADFSHANDRIYAYADYNKNGLFESNEQLGTVAFPSGVSKDSILFNPFSVTGAIRMRLICYSGSQISEVEDYTLNISGTSALSFPAPHIAADLVYKCDSYCYYTACPGQVTLHDYGCGQTTYRLWSIPGASPPTSGAKNPVFTFADTGNYYITLTDSNSLGSSTTNSWLHISSPVAAVHLGRDTAICNGGSLLLSAPSATGGACYSYLWSTGETTRQITAHSSGNFSVRVTSCSSSSCPATDTIKLNFSPQPFSVTGGGSDCTGGATFNVGLSNSETGVDYQLKLNGNPVGVALHGNGALLNFGTQSSTGTYTVVATNVSLGCTASMLGSAIIAVGHPPVAMHVIGGGTYCSGSAGVVVKLDSSVSSVRYQLFRNGVPTLSTLTGNDSVLVFPNQPSGTYTVIATDIHTSCTARMADSAVIQSLLPPSVFNVTGGGSFCGGTLNSSVHLSDSENGIVYKLIRNGVQTGDTLRGTGSSISFSYLLQSGNYTIAATDNASCSANMNGSATLSLSQTPTPFVLSGGGVYCDGDSVLPIILSNSEINVRYQLYVDSNYVGNSLNGNGHMLNFGVQLLPGTYFVIGSHNITACWLPMHGSPKVEIHGTAEIYDITGGGHYCAGGPGANVTLSNSDTSFYYQLYWNNNPYGIPVHGVGGPLDFGFQSNPGVYFMVAEANGSCADTMNGTVEIFMDSVPGSEIISQIPDTVCLFHSAIPLAGIPSGGIFSGNGIVNDTMYPLNAGAGVHIIYYTVTDGVCSSVDKDTLIVEPCIGIEEIDFSGDIFVYPNPASEFLEINFSLKRQSEVSIEIFNSLGKEVYYSDKGKISGEQKVRIGNLNYADGVYLVRIETGSSSITRRFIVRQ